MRRIPDWTPPPGSTSKATKAAYACGTCHKVRRLQETVDDYVTETLLERLSADDAIEILATGDPAAAAQARLDRAAAQARLEVAADAYAAGNKTVSWATLERISATVEAEIAQCDAVIAESLPRTIPDGLIGLGARQRWETLSLDVQRATVRELMRVEIMPTRPGQRRFDPSSVRIHWNARRSIDGIPPAS